MYDELRRHPLRLRYGHVVCDRVTDVGLGREGVADVVSFTYDGRRYTFKGLDLSIDGRHGCDRSVRLGIFDAEGRLLFLAMLPAGVAETCEPGPWREDLARLHRVMAAVMDRRRRIENYGIDEGWLALQEAMEADPELRAEMEALDAEEEAATDGRDPA